MLSLVRSAVYEDVHTGQIARYNQQFNRYPACSARCKSDFETQRVVPLALLDEVYSKLSMPEHRKVPINDLKEVLDEFCNWVNGGAVGGRDVNIQAASIATRFMNGRQGGKREREGEERAKIPRREMSPPSPRRAVPTNGKPEKGHLERARPAHKENISKVHFRSGKLLRGKNKNYGNGGLIGLVRHGSYYEVDL
ncbi:hypothetical protein Anapl_17012 [Anas platyrhynchos]|uniref:Uncharacterized protein n=1 Tax=Anas platyrhynchos TaxID=8839 RepID=R0L2B2_ANAPL|nr:hypothetical protein Anapl_17012 [Anas platyrhynchos]